MTVYIIEDMGKAFQEDMQGRINSSLSRLQRINSFPNCTERFASETAKLEKRFEIRRTACTLGIPRRLTNGPNFKYVSQLLDCRTRISRGEKLTVIYVFDCRQEVVGFAIVKMEDVGNEIEIIDTDKRFRRREAASGCKLSINVDSQKFEVGLGHVVANSVAKFVDKPIRVYASTEQSEYIFRSLGYQESDSEYLCLGDNSSEDSEAGARLATRSDTAGC